MTHVEIKTEIACVNAPPAPDAEGVWRSKPTTETYTRYIVVVDGVRDTSHPTLEAAQLAAEKRAFMSALIDREPGAYEALGSYLDLPRQQD